MTFDMFMYTALAQNGNVSDVMDPCTVTGRQAKVVSCRCP